MLMDYTCLHRCSTMVEREACCLLHMQSYRSLPCDRLSRRSFCRYVSFIYCQDYEAPVRSMRNEEQKPSQGARPSDDSGVNPCASAPPADSPPNSQRTPQGPE